MLSGRLTGVFVLTVNYEVKVLAVCYIRVCNNCLSLSYIKKLFTVFSFSKK